jgi:non-ribosomal peptide synthetase component F
MKRSLEMVIGLLGILKPVADMYPRSGYPPDRLALMIEDSQLPVLLTDSVALADNLRLQSIAIAQTASDQIPEQPLPPIKVVCLETECSTSLNTVKKTLIVGSLQTTGLYHLHIWLYR